jgi:hypothetical protein
MDLTETTAVAAIIMSGLVRTHSHGVGVDMNEEQRDKVVETSLDLAERLQRAVVKRMTGKKEKPAAAKAAAAPFDAA